MAGVSSSWLTAVRLERLCAVLCGLPSSQQGGSVDEVIHQIWGAVGGEKIETITLVKLLEKLGLVMEKESQLRRTREGDRICKAVRSGDRTTLGYALVRGGIFHDQARYLLEAGRIDVAGDLRCEPRVGRIGAAQLIGLLGWWDIPERPHVVIPKPLLGELNNVWAMLPPEPETPAWMLERKAIGDRAEMYSVQFERLHSKDPSRIVWVARDSDSLGWDVEDRTTSKLRRIEVKGSQGLLPSFYLSENEWKKAREHADSYEVHFWGAIDRNRAPAEEFATLLAAGFPLIVRDIVSQVDSGLIEAQPVKWRVTLQP